MLAFLFSLLLSNFVSTPLYAVTATPQKTVTIVALGDSLTDGYGLDKNQAYPKLVEEKFHKDGMAQVKVLNAGISGSTSAGSDKRLNWFLKSKPQILLLALGANDGLRGVPPAHTRENLIKTIRVAQKNKIHVILAGMMLPPNYGQEYTEKFRAMYKEVAQAEKVDLIPFLLEGVAGDQKLNQEDGIHPNAQGQIKLADNVYKYLKPAVLKILKSSN